MCGILFSCQDAQGNEEGTPVEYQELFRKLKEANTSRGPDAQDILTTSVNSIELKFFASELHLRGDNPIAQPHHDDTGSILCWNGEIFEGIEVSAEENDGIKLFESLHKAKTSEDVRDVLGCIEDMHWCTIIKLCSRYSSREIL